MNRLAASSSTPNKDSHRLRFGASQYHSSSGVKYQVYDIGQVAVANGSNYDGTESAFQIMYGSASTQGGLANAYVNDSVWKVRSNGTMEIKIQSSDPTYTYSNYGVLWAKGTALYYKSQAGGTTYNLTAGGGTTVNAGTVGALAYYSATDTVDGPASGLKYDPTIYSNDGALLPSGGDIASNAYLGRFSQQSESFQGVSAGNLWLGSYVSSTNWRTVRIQPSSSLTESYTITLPQQGAALDGAMLYSDVLSTLNTLTWTDNSESSTDHMMLWLRDYNGAPEFCPTLQLTGQGDQVMMSLRAYSNINGSGGEPAINFFRSKSTSYLSKTATASNDDIYEIKGYGVNGSSAWSIMSAIKTVQVESAGTTYNGSRIIMQTSKKNVGIAGTTQAEYQLVLDEKYAVGVGVVPSQTNNAYSFVVGGHENYAGNYVNLGGKNTYYAIYTTGNVLALGYYTISDTRLKENTATITGSQALTAINALNPITYKWVDSYYSTADATTVPQTDAGFKSTEFATVFPNSVKKSQIDLIKDDSTGKYRTGTEAGVGETKEVEDIETIDSAVIIPYLVAAIKDLEARIKILEG